MKFLVFALFAACVLAQTARPLVPLPAGAPADCVPDVDTSFAEAAAAGLFPIMDGEPTCCCPDHPGPPRCYPDTPCNVIPVRFCQGSVTSWKVCPTESPTLAPTTRQPTTRGPTTRNPTPVPPTPRPTLRPTTRGPTTRAPTSRAPTTRNPTPVPPTPRPTLRPTRSPTPEPTSGPVCDCIFDPKLPALPGFPVDICEGFNSHRCVCTGCDYTFNRADCVEWVQFDITSDTFWSRQSTYLIKGEIHVCQGAQLTIEPGTVVIFEDWPVQVLLDRPRPAHTTSVWSVLVVDSDSSIIAENVSFEGKSKEAQQLAAGLVVLGTSSSITHPQYASIASVAANSAGRRRSSLNKVRLVNLGHAGTQLGSLSLIATSNSDIVLDHIFIGNAGSHGLRTWDNTATVNGLTSTRVTEAALSAAAGSVFDITAHAQLQGHNGIVTDTSSSVTLKAGAYWNIVDRIRNEQTTVTVDTVLN